MRRTGLGIAAALCVLTAGCSPGTATAPTTTSTAPVIPVSASTSPASAPASEAPTVPTKTEDTADLKKAMLKPADLGKPWVQPKAVSTVKTKQGEVCPGHVSAVEKVSFVAQLGTDLTEGRGAGKNIASLRLKTLADSDGTALAAAYAQDQRACARYREASGYYVVRSVEGPKASGSAEPVSTWVERIYYDKQHKQLAYARHNLVGRQGRVVTYVSYAFLTVKKDPNAKDFTRAQRIFDTQLAKNATVFS